MKKKIPMCGYNRKTRRRNSLTRLEIQLESGKKRQNRGIVPLTKLDEKRIIKEVETLKLRIV